MKTAFLLALLTLGFVYVGHLLGGTGGMVFAFILAVVMNFGAYWYSDKVVLKMYRAQEVASADAPQLYNMVENIAMQAGIPTPRVYVIPSAAPNAFATGRNPENGAVALTQGIMKILDRDELEGVIAHEMGHIKNRDILIGSIAATFAGAIGMLAHMAGFALMFGGFGGDDDEGGGGIGAILMIVLAPIMAMIVQMAVSRAREYKADESAARFTHKPLALASALKKISDGSERIPLKANPGAAHMLILNPLRGGFSGLFRTHPPTEERIAKLEQMAYSINV